eukprot:15912_1
MVNNNTNNQSWKYIDDLLYSAHGHRVITFGHDILVIGGYSNEYPGNYLDVVQVIDTETGHISFGGNMSFGVYESAVINVNNIVYAFGGYNIYLSMQRNWQYYTLPQTNHPTRSPSTSTQPPTPSPTFSPSNTPTNSPTAPSYSPTNAPTKAPTISPSNTPSFSPSIYPTNTPSGYPSKTPSYPTSNASTDNTNSNTLTLMIIIIITLCLFCVIIIFSLTF